MDITLSIPNAKKDLILDSIATHYKYQDTVSVNVLDPSGNLTYDPSSGQVITTIEANPISKGAFCKSQIIDMIKGNVKGFIHQQTETEMYTTLKIELEEIDGIDIT